MALPPNEETKLLDMLKDPATRHNAFELLVNNTSRQLYSIIRNIVQFHDDADDVLQNTYLKAWQAIGNFRGDSQLSSWLYRIAVNESITFLNKKQNTVSLANEESEELQEIRKLESDPYFDGDEAELQLQKAIATLPDKQRTVFCMKYLQEMKYEEISQMLGTTVGALKASYHLATKKIEQYLGSEH